MTQTQRTLAQLLERLPNNTSGTITPERVRDIVESLTPTRGGMTKDGSTTTVVAETGAWVKIAGPTTPLSQNELRHWSAAEANALRYEGTASQAVNVFGKVSIDPGEGNTEWSVTVALNDTPLPDFVATVALAGPQSGNAEATVPITASLIVETDDVLSVYIRRDAGDGNVDITAMVVNVTGFAR
jgi:hypothetical protein